MKNKKLLSLIMLALVFAIFVFGVSTSWILYLWPHLFERLFYAG